MATSRAALHALVRPALVAQLRAGAPDAVGGLDVSTRHVGLAVLRGDGALVAASVLSCGAAEGAFPFARRVRAALADAHAATPLARVGIEDVMKTFSAGRFTTQGIHKLERLNGIVSYNCWDVLG